MSKTSKTTETPAPAKGVCDLVLLVIHVAVLIGTVLLHPISLSHADGALPTDIS
jgi:hypothetical protein